MERVMKWVALDFDGHDWPAVALWLVVAELTLMLIAIVVDVLFFGSAPFAFWTAMLLFTGHVFLDASTAGMRKPLLWAGFVTFAPAIGAFFYARRRRYHRRPVEA